MRPRTRAFFAAALGIFLLLVHARLDLVMPYSALFGPMLVFVAVYELWFWLVHALIVLPASLLLAYAVVPFVESALTGVRAGFGAFSRREWRMAAVCYFVLLFAIAHIGRTLFLLDLPITDDENAVLFGARMVAEGDLSVPLLQPEGAFVTLFGYVRDGRISSMDFPGGIFFRALGIVTGTDAVPYALLSAATGVAVSATAGRLVGPSGYVLAALFWAVSPMAYTLSMTAHAHVVSRGFVAFAFLFFVRISTPEPDDRPNLNAAMLGLCAGLGFLARPGEVGLLLVPAAGWLVVNVARRKPGAGRIFVSACLGLLGPALVFAWYNHAMTGDPFLMPRMGGGVTESNVMRLQTPWERFGTNLGFNLVMLSVWFLGPIGLVLAWLGISRGSSATQVLGAGMALGLGLALITSNTGVHMVGPIHYSEFAVPLAVLATVGVVRGSSDLISPQVSHATRIALILGYCLGGLGSFNFMYSGMLREQAEFQMIAPEAVRQLEIENAIVLAPPPRELAALRRSLTGTWVLSLPHPDPYFRDSVLFAKADADLAALREQFPDRQLYRMFFSAGEPPVTVVKLGNTDEVSE